MQFSNFLFPESKSPDTDSVIINETLREAELDDGLWEIKAINPYGDGLAAKRIRKVIEDQL